MAVFTSSNNNLRRFCKLGRLALHVNVKVRVGKHVLRNSLIDSTCLICIPNSFYKKTRGSYSNFEARKKKLRSYFDYEFNNNTFTFFEVSIKKYMIGQFINQSFMFYLIVPNNTVRNEKSNVSLLKERQQHVICSVSSKDNRIIYASFGVLQWN